MTSFRKSMFSRVERAMKATVPRTLAFTKGLKTCISSVFSLGSEVLGLGRDAYTSFSNAFCP